MTFLLYLVVPASEAFVLKDPDRDVPGAEAEFVHQVDHVVLGRHEPLHVLARDRMVEAEAGGMQRLAVEVELVLDLDREAGRAAAVDLVADERQVLAREVDADLVRAARVEAAGDPGDGQALDGAPAHAAGTSACRLGAHARAAGEALEAGAAARIAADRRLDDEVGRGGAEREGPVLALDGALLKLAHEVRLGGKRAGDNHEAGRVAVEAVDDARTGHLAELGIAPQQAVEQRAAGVARARMHDETGGLVDDDDRIVLVDHVELHVLLGREGERLVKMGLLEQRDLVALGDLLAHLLDDLAVHLDASLLDELLQTSSGNIGHQGGENLVKAFSPEPFHRETW